jgi:phosphate/sulfate permease
MKSINKKVDSFIRSVLLVFIGLGLLLGQMVQSCAETLAEDSIRQEQPIAFVINYDSIVVRHQMKSTGWPDSTVHTHVTYPGTQ